MTTENFDNEATQYISENNGFEQTQQPEAAADLAPRKSGNTAKNIAIGATAGILIGAAAPFMMGQELASKVYFGAGKESNGEKQLDKVDDNNIASAENKLSDNNTEDNVVVDTKIEENQDAKSGNDVTGHSDVANTDVENADTNVDAQIPEVRNYTININTQPVAEETVKPQETVAESQVAAPALVIDPSLKVATGISDTDTFAHAFAEARGQVGTPGVFEWKGNLYSTYTAEEWDNLGPKGRSDYASNFAWDRIDHTNSPVYAAADSLEYDNEEIEVMSDDELNNIQLDENYQLANEEIAVEPEVELLGIAYDEMSGANVAGVSVDGNEVVLIDVDGDLVYDYVAGDINGDGQISEDEVADISSEGFSIADLNQATNNGITDALASDGTIGIDDSMVYDA